MDLLEALPGRDRERFLAAATVVRLQRGDALILTGDRGGDLYRVVEGDVEVVDTRSSPPVILEVLGRGSMVGEMAFLDEHTRSADVRAADTAVCQRWSKATILKLIDQDPQFGIAFYRSLASLVVARARSVTTHAIAGNLGPNRARSAAHIGAGAAAEHLAEDLVNAIVQAEPLLRRDRDRGEREILALLHTFQEHFPTVIQGLPDAEQLAAGEGAARVLHPYLMRSHLGELALDQADGHPGDAHAVEHVLSGEAVGDGPVGELLDAWLTGLATGRGFRERNVELQGQVLEGLPADPPARITLINSVAAGIPARILEDLRRAGGEVAVVEARRERLQALQNRRGSPVKLRLIQEDPLSLLRGEPRWSPLGSTSSGGDPAAKQDVVLVDAMLDYLPDRVAVTLLSSLRTWLKPGGRLVVSALAESPDEPLWRFLLRWPTVRRTEGALTRLLESAGLRELRCYSLGAGLVGVGLGRRE